MSKFTCKDVMLQASNSQQQVSHKMADEGHKFDSISSSSIVSLSDRLLKTNLAVNQVMHLNQSERQSKQLSDKNTNTRGINQPSFSHGLSKNSSNTSSEVEKILKEIQICVQISPITAQRAKDVYSAYLKVKRSQNSIYNSINVSSSRTLLLTCAVFIASHFENDSQKERSQKIRPLSLSDIIQKNLLNISDKNGVTNERYEIDDFISTFRDVQRTLPVQSKAVKQTLQKCLLLCQNFQTSLKIYNKFDAVWSNICSSEIMNGSKFKTLKLDLKIKKSLWLLFLICKYELFESGYLNFGQKSNNDINMIKQDYYAIQTQNIRQSNHLVDYAFLIVAVCQQFVIDMVEENDVAAQVDKDAVEKVLRAISSKIIQSQLFDGETENAETVIQFRSKIVEIMQGIMNKDSESKSRKRSASPVTRQIRLATSFLNQNENEMARAYDQIVSQQPDKFDERQFANYSEKIKTPQKMVQSPFNARIGPMQRQTKGQMDGSGVNPPAAPSKRQLFPQFGNGDTAANANSKMNQQNTRNSQEPPSKRQEIEAPLTKLTHINTGESNDQGLASDQITSKDQIFANDALNKDQLPCNNIDEKGHQIQKCPFQSRRVLDFTNQKQETQNPTLLTKLNEVQFPNHVGQTPYQNKIASKHTATVPNTPITEIIKLRNWHMAKIRKTQLTFDESVLPAQKLILSKKLLEYLEIENVEQEKQFNKEITTLCSQLIEKIILGLARKQIERNGSHLRRQQNLQIILESDQNQNDREVQIFFKQLKEKHFDNIFGMTAQLLEKIFQTHHDMGKVNDVKKLIHSEIFIKSIIICTSELQYFIYDVHDLQCCEVAELIEQPPFDFWRILSIFLKIYADMPRRICIHFREIELRIISCLAWKKGSSVLKILEFMKQQAHSDQVNGRKKDLKDEQMGHEEQKSCKADGLTEKQRQKLLPYNCFFSRVLQASASIIVDLCNMLKINPEYQEVIWSIMKSLLSCEPQLLIERHVHQLVMCTIYGVKKISNDMKSINFNSIIDRYANLYENTEYVTQIYTHCVINPETGETRDIINFYNDVYLKKMRPYILLYKDECFTIQKNLELKALHAKEQSMATQQKALTPGTYTHISSHSSMLTMNKPQPQAIRTPKETKMIVRAFCPKTPLYDQLSNCKNNLNMRVVVSRGTRNAHENEFMSTPDSSKFYGQGMIPQNQMNGLQSNSMNSYQHQNGNASYQKNYYKTVIENNQNCQTSVNDSQNTKGDQLVHRKTVSSSNVQTINSKNNTTAISGKPPRPLLNGIQAQQANKDGSQTYTETIQITAGVVNKVNGYLNEKNNDSETLQMAQNSAAENVKMDEQGQNVMAGNKNFQKYENGAEFAQSKMNTFDNNKMMSVSPSGPPQNPQHMPNGGQHQLYGKAMNDGYDCNKAQSNVPNANSVVVQPGSSSQMKMNLLNRIKKTCANNNDHMQN